MPRDHREPEGSDKDRGGVTGIKYEQNKCDNKTQVRQQKRRQGADWLRRQRERGRTDGRRDTGRRKDKRAGNKDRK